MNRRRMPAALLVLIDVLLTGATLVVFALFHHVIPQEFADVPVDIIQSQSATDTVSKADVELITVPVKPADYTIKPDNTILDMRTDWQKKFEDKFSKEPVWTENSYKSPNVSITIDTITKGSGDDTLTYHFADIYIGNIECFQRYFAKNKYGFVVLEKTIDMDIASDALIAISGDYYGNTRESGVVIKNGQFYRSKKTDADICILYKDGVMETYPYKEFDINKALERGAYQSWSFGPALLDSEGKAITKFTGYAKKISGMNPRSSVGYFEPGHYCFITVDGRQNGYSRGARMYELSQIYADLGCKAAYNLDGGQTAVMTFHDRIFSKPADGGRRVSDILLIKEVEK